MSIDETDRDCLRRQGRYLAAAFKRPHRVLSTCRINGGLREDLTHIANHQSCEGVEHTPGADGPGTQGAAGFHHAARVAGNLPPETTALMPTPANMQCAVLRRATHADLEVRVAATAGVLGNATRAGDPAGWHEYPDGSRPLVRRGVDAAYSGTGHAAAVAVDPAQIGDFRPLLAAHQDLAPGRLAALAVTLGLERKWR